MVVIPRTIPEQIHVDRHGKETKRDETQWTVAVFAFKYPKFLRMKHI